MHIWLQYAFLHIRSNGTELQIRGAGFGLTAVSGLTVFFISRWSAVWFLRCSSIRILGLSLSFLYICTS
jgi:hypothetical protein